MICIKIKRKFFNDQINAFQYLNAQAWWQQRTRGAIQCLHLFTDSPMQYFAAQVCWVGDCIARTGQALLQWQTLLIFSQPLKVISHSHFTFSVVGRGSARPWDPAGPEAPHLDLHDHHRRDCCREYSLAHKISTGSDAHLHAFHWPHKHYGRTYTEISYHVPERGDVRLCPRIHCNGHRHHNPVVALPWGMSFFWNDKTWKVPNNNFFPNLHSIPGIFDVFLNNSKTVYV